MPSLYAIKFSTRFIKVGRAVSAETRIAEHAARLFVGGVDVVDSFHCALIGDPHATEAALIDWCASAGCTDRRGNEWFAGLDFKGVCAELARQCAIPHQPIIGYSALKEFLRSLPDEPAREAFAVSCKTTLGNIRKTLYADQCSLGPITCVLVERMSGGQVKRQELRPDWRDIWPELAEAATEGAA